MINTLIGAISNKLLSLFADAVIYTEKVPQKFITPSFYVKCITHSGNMLLFDNRRKSTTFDIVYFPTENSLTAQEEMNNILAELVDKMISLEINNKVFKATDISIEKVDGVLHYFVNFNFNTLYRKERVMEALNLREVGINDSN